jgi:hypothetical protein
MCVFVFNQTVTLGYICAGSQGTYYKIRSLLNCCQILNVMLTMRSEAYYDNAYNYLGAAHIWPPSAPYAHHLCGLQLDNI